MRQQEHQAPSIEHQNGLLSQRDLVWDTTKKGGGVRAQGLHLSAWLAHLAGLQCAWSADFARLLELARDARHVPKGADERQPGETPTGTVTVPVTLTVTLYVTVTWARTQRLGIGQAKQELLH